MRRRIIQNPDKPEGKFGMVLDEGHRNAFRGKKIAIFVDGCDHAVESFLLQQTVFETLGAEGQVVKYSELFSGASVQADFILLRSSRNFGFEKEALKTALERLRKDNPGALIILCAYDPSVFRFAEPLAASRLVDVLDDTLVGSDLRLIVDAAKAKMAGGG
jgi:hypothetical protein